MTPVYQTKTVDEHGYGTCLSACLASLLDLPERAVPVFSGPRWPREGGNLDLGARCSYGDLIGWWQALHVWAYAMGLDLDAVGGGRPDLLTERYVIANGVSPRQIEGAFTRYHSTIYERQADGTYALVHDPHPAGGGVVGAPTSYYQILGL